MKTLDSFFPTRGSAFRWHEPFAVLIIFLSALLILGYRLIDNNTLEYFIYFKATFSKDWLPQDYWVPQIGFWNIRTGFLLHIYVLQLFFGLKFGFLIGYLLSLLLLILAVRSLAKEIFKILKVPLSPNWVILIMLLTPFHKRVSRVIGGHDIFEGSLLASFAATVPVYWGFIWLLRGKYHYALPLFAYAAFLHIQVGGLFLILSSVLFVLEKRKQLKEILSTYLLITPFLILPLYVIYLSGVLHPENIDLQEVWEGYLWRIPHHMFPHHFGAGHWENFYWRLVLVSFLLFFLLRAWRQSPSAEWKHLIFRMGGAVGLVAVLIGGAVYAIEGLQNLTILKLQVFRLDYATCFLAAIGMVVVVYKFSDRFLPFLRNIPWLLLVGLYAVALASDRIAQEHVFRSWEERFTFLELPGENPQSKEETFLKEIRPLIPSGSTVAVGMEQAAGYLQLHLRLILNVAGFYTRGLTPHIDAIWPDFNQRRRLTQAFEQTATLENLQAIHHHQPIDFLIDVRPLDWLELLHAKEGLYLYKMPILINNP